MTTGVSAPPLKRKKTGNSFVLLGDNIYDSIEAIAKTITNQSITDNDLIRLFIDSAFIFFSLNRVKTYTASIMAAMDKKDTVIYMNIEYLKSPIS